MVTFATISNDTDILNSEFKIDQLLGYWLAGAFKSLKSRLIHNFHQAGYPLQIEHWVIMAMCSRCEGAACAQKAVVEKMNGDKTSISRAVSDLEQLNWVAQKTDKGDKRNKLLGLTAKGREMMPILAASVQLSISEVTKDISEEEIEICKSVLKRIIENTNSLKTVL